MDYKRMAVLSGSIAVASCLMGADMNWKPLSAQLVNVNSQVLTPDETAGASQMLRDDLMARLRDANQQDADSIYQMRWQQAWEQVRDDRLQALVKSMGTPPSAPMQVETTGTIPGDGFRIEKLVIAGRPGLPITANLYLPDPLRAKMPAILICSSHHNPKHQVELQDMGMTWARAGTMVLVPDNLGHGERRQQPFAGREDYHWRYNLGIQLNLVGQSLIGWMVADLRRCLDVLLARPDVDARRIIMMGAVAGGGEPAAITSALDARVTCSIPFNFGSGYQSELPGEAAFYRWDGFGDWESTRCLRNSGRDLFFPWLIVAAAAPRPLIFAKEFAFDGAKDPAYQRVRGVYQFYDAVDRIGEVHGFGNVRLNPPAASHCNNVGPFHRKQIYPLLQKWLDMPIPQEYQHRLEPKELNCMTPQAEAKFAVRPVNEVAAEVASRQLAQARKALVELPAAERRRKVQQEWARLLGDIEPPAAPCVKRATATQPATDIRPEKVLLSVGPRIDVPVLMLSPLSAAQPATQPVGPSTRASSLVTHHSSLGTQSSALSTSGSGLRTQDSGLVRRPVVICIAQQGKGEFLVRRAGEIAQLLAQGVVVCLPDLRGMGETSPGPDRTYTAAVTEISAENLKLGQPLLGSRLRDLRAVIRYLATRDDVDATRLALWGDSFAPANPAEFVDPPLRTNYPPQNGEPAGAILAILGALFEDNVKAVVARGCLTSYAAILDAPAFYVPHDAVVPGALEAADVPDLAAALAPLSLRLESFVDGRNRPAGREALDEALASVRKAYAAAPARLVVNAAAQPDAGAWLARALVPEATSRGQ
jgi:dienelactone hydrolase